jgi:L-amino acid N-acyltransferase YncA
MHLDAYPATSDPSSDGRPFSVRRSPPLVRDSADIDLQAIQSIYAHHVLHGTASFETAPPPIEEMALRRQAVLAAGLPHLVAVIDGRVAGYCYAGIYRPRPAYRHTIENSVYVAHDRTRQGIGKALMAALLERCEAGPWRQMIAVIGGSANGASIGLHRELGFEHVGTLRSVGYKFDQWLDTVLMQRAIGPGDSEPGVSERRAARA